MRRFLPPLILLMTGFIAFQCCTSKTPRSKKPVSTVTLSPQSKTYLYSQPLQITVTTKVPDGELDKVLLYLNGELLATSDQLTFQYNIDGLSLLGQNTLRVIAEKKDGINSTRIQNFEVVSDKKPDRYTFEIIREHPHSTANFTQGLEFYQGHLYEGTGENGKSGIFKTILETGRVLQSKMLDEKYFGEGITILNGKLYQLTYKHKMGFVYRLTDFAVIDSFRFESKEGWGLTNDGKSLIMSDGTGTLTWINPDNFSVEKRLQVADHQRGWQYLNELEYVDGSVWANVWTTNQIIRIDANTGKIMGFVELEGILSIMHKSHLERIDVMNGVAYLKNNGNFLITGKLWPKIFESRIDF